MDKIVKLFRLIECDPRQLLIAFFMRVAKSWSDRPYLNVLHFLNTGQVMDWETPKTYSEKCQWMKLYYQRPELIQMVDKYDVKKYVSERIGPEYVVACFGVWDHFDDIDFNSLPDSFVLKCTHNSGKFVICKDKKTFDKTRARRVLEPSLKESYFHRNREWVYKHVRPRILAEKYMDTLGRPDSIEYKITCMGGAVSFVTICGGIAHAKYSQRTNNHYTRDWQPMPWYARYKPSGKTYEKTPEIDKMIELSEVLSKGIPQVRVDWYIHDGKIYFGEMTFYTWAGWPHFTPKEWDAKLGEHFILPSEKRQET